jgi:hypothetical protein
VTARGASRRSRPLAEIADLVLLHADPLFDIGNLRRIKAE